MAGDILARMFSWQPGPPMVGAGTLLTLVLLSAALSHFGPNTWEIRYQWRPLSSAALAVLFILCLVVIYGGNQSQFLYFQF
jgi:hypothetical protein